MKLETFLARRYLSSQRGKGLSVITWIALAGVVVGVMSLICVLAVMSGFEKELRTKILGNNAYILVRLTTSATLDEFNDVIGAIRKLPRVGSAMPVIYGEGFILSPRGESEGVLLKG